MVYRKKKEFRYEAICGRERGRWMSWFRKFGAREDLLQHDKRFRTRCVHYSRGSANGVIRSLVQLLARQTKKAPE